MCLCLWLSIVFSCLFHGRSPIRHFYQPNLPRNVAMFWQVKVAPELECSICCEMLSTKEVSCSLVKNIDVSLVLCQLKHRILFWARRFPSFNPICNIWSQFWHLAILLVSRRGKISSWTLFYHSVLQRFVTPEEVVALPCETRGCRGQSQRFGGAELKKRLRFPCPASPSRSVSPVRRKMIYQSLIFILFFVFKNDPLFSV